MKVLVVGGGGREHALVWKISQSPLVDKVFCAPGNAGIGEIAENVDIKADDIPNLKKFALDEKMDLTVVGPEGSLALSVVDNFSEDGLKIFGPNRKAAALEGSKLAAKILMKKYEIPSAPFEDFSNAEKAIVYVKSQEFPLVVKADGLAAGKGVTVCSTLDEALDAIDRIMVKKEFGDAGNRLIVEGFLDGEEASYISMVDMEGHMLDLATSQDHKARDEGDKGPNTGGMGAYSPAPVITPEVEERIKTQVMYPVVKAMIKEGMPFSGFLYAGLKIKDANPYVLEFNVRLGDPEAQPILMRMKSDIVPIILAALNNNLNVVDIEWDPDPAVCVVMASKGYPGSYDKGAEIFGSMAEREGVKIFHAGTAKNSDGAIVAAGGRVLGVTATGSDFRKAQENAYRGVRTIGCEDLFYRHDIAYRAVDRK